jgi:mitochondrial import inner membrane translocase subunit TIM17
LIEYVGETYLIGAGLGSVLHLIKGLGNSPSGGRLAGAVLAIGTHVPRYASINGTYGGVFCAVESAVSRAHGKDEDHWNSVTAGAVTTGLFRVRRGAAGSALLGATVFAGVVALGLCYQHHMACVEAKTYRPLPAPIPIITEDEKGAVYVRFHSSIMSSDVLKIVDEVFFSALIWLLACHN